MRNFTSDARLKDRFNKEQNILLSRRLKQIKPTINTHSPEATKYLKTLNNNKNKIKKIKGGICKLYNL